jgi:hypothetical protein
MATIKTIIDDKGNIYFGSDSVFHLLREDETIYLREERMAIANYISGLIKRIKEGTKDIKRR